MRHRSFLIAGILLLLQGCTYALSADVLRSADRSVTFDQLLRDPSSFTGKTVVLGGVITGNRALKRGTMIEVAQKELDYWGKPRRTRRSGGRFLLFSPRPLDAMIYAPGREITVAAEVTGKEGKGLGESGYPSPLLNARELKLWPQERQARDNPSWLDPLYDPSAPQNKYGY